MANSMQLALASVMSQDQLHGLRNVLTNTFRAIDRLVSGHETLILVIFVMLILIYLYIRKA